MFSLTANSIHAHLRSIIPIIGAEGVQGGAHAPTFQDYCSMYVLYVWRNLVLALTLVGHVYSSYRGILGGGGVSLKNVKFRREIDYFGIEIVDSKGGNCFSGGGGGGGGKCIHFSPGVLCKCTPLSEHQLVMGLWCE